MAGIPLPALAVHTQTPNEAENAFANLMRLRQLGIAQKLQAQNDAQRNTAYQQEAQADVARQQLAQQKYQQQQAVSQKINSLVPQAMDANGKIDYGKLKTLFAQNNLGSLYPSVAQNYQSIDAANQKLAESGISYDTDAAKYGQLMGQIASKMPHTPATAQWLIGKIGKHEPQQANLLEHAFYADPSGTWARIDAGASKLQRGTFVDPANGQPFPGTIQPNGAGVVNDITGNVVPNARLYEHQSPPKPTAGMLNGKRTWGVWRGDGWYSTSGQPLPGFAPLEPSRSGSGSAKFTPQNPAPQQMFQALDDEKGAKLRELQGWYNGQLGKADLSADPQAFKANLARDLLAKKQQVQDWYEAQNRKLGGEPKHFSYFQQSEKPLTLALAKQFLLKAGGDKNRARELAHAAGYSF